MTPDVVDWLKKQKYHTGRNAALAVSIIIGILYAVLKFFLPEHVQVGIVEFMLMSHGAMTITYEFLLKEKK